MPGKVGRSPRRLLVPLVVVVLLFCFTPISRALLRSVDGSFAPTPFSSLALKDASRDATGFVVGTSIPVQLTNRTGRTTTYHWIARESGSLISLGEETLGNGKTAKFSVPSRGTVAGVLEISLSDTSVFITVPLKKK
jgi:hypothetical protein